MPNAQECYLKNGPLSFASVKLVLGNLFRKESDGGPIEFFIRRLLVPEDEQHLNKYATIKNQIEECGGCLLDMPKGNYSVELAFPEAYKDSSERGYTRYIFNVNYITDCVEQRELLGLEDYRIGDYNPSEVKDANQVLKGLKPWTEIRFSTQNQQGVKLPDFGCPAPSSSFLTSPDQGHSRKKARAEYTLDEDYAILTHISENELYDKVGGITIWRNMENKFPNRSYQSLQTRFRRHIQPNISRYSKLSEKQRKLFQRLQSAFPIDDVAEPSDSPSTSDRMPPTKGYPTTSPTLAPMRVVNIAEEPSEPRAGHGPRSAQPRGQQSSPILTPVRSAGSARELEIPKAGPALSSTRITSPTSAVNAESKDQQLTHPSPILAPPRLAKNAEGTGESQSPAAATAQNKSLYFSPLNEEPQLPETRTEARTSDLAQSETAKVRLRNQEDMATEAPEQPRGAKPAGQSGVALPTSEDASGADQLRRDRLLLNFIAKNKLFNRVNGNKLWKKVQEKFLRGTTQDCQAVKARFFDTIIKDVLAGKHELDNDSLAQLNKHCLSSATKTMPARESEEADSDSSISSLSFENGVSSTPIKPGLQRASTTTSSKISSKRSIGASTTKPHRRDYTMAEDKLILSYIIRTARFNEVRGKVLWVDIQDTVLHEYGRTWESAKNRYLRTIVRNLKRYNLEPTTIQDIENGLVEQRYLGGSRREPSGTSKRVENSITEESSDEEALFQPQKKKSKRPSEEDTAKEPVKHPAHLSPSKREPKKKPQKRALYRPNIVPLTIERPASAGEP